MNSKILVYNPNQLRKKQRTIYKKKSSTGCHTLFNEFTTESSISKH